VFALTSSSAQALAVAISFVLFGLAFLVLKFIKSVTTKAVGLIVIFGLILGLWDQRGAVKDCADQVVRTAGASTQCDFFGWKVDVGVRKNTTP
jgi:hypothetical protein